MFERKFFWINMISVALLFFMSFVTLAVPFFDTPYKLGQITAFVIIYAWYRQHIWNKLTAMETTWKNYNTPQTPTEIAGED